VRGHLQDNNIALVNGDGISIALDNWSLVESGNKLQSLPQDKDENYYAEQTPLKCYVRPQTGKGNPRSEIQENLDTSTDIADMLHQAVKQFRQTQTATTVIPKWVTDAENILNTRKHLPRF
jgi:hypothetical protein